MWYNHMSMSVVPVHPLPPTAVYTEEPLYKLSVEQYHQMIENGTLMDDDPVELIEGVLVFKMPKYPPHVFATGRLSKRIPQLLPDGWHYRAQEPVTLPDGEPEPDGTIVRGTDTDYIRRHPHPSDVAILIEVAEATLDRDRRMKLRTYAKAGILEYWIVNLMNCTIAAYSDPDPSGKYRSVVEYKVGQRIAIRLDHVVVGEVDVADIFPPVEQSR